jgi:hypothetical protein
LHFAFEFRFTDIFDRPLQPIWFIAAFPDITKFCVRNERNQKHLRDILFSGMTEEQIKLYVLSKPDSLEKIMFSKILINNYRDKINNKFETQND